MTYEELCTKYNINNIEELENVLDVFDYIKRCLWLEKSVKDWIAKHDDEAPSVWELVSDSFRDSLAGDEYNYETLSDYSEALEHLHIMEFINELKHYSHNSQLFDRPVRSYKKDKKE